MSFDLELNGNLASQRPRLNVARFGDDLVLYWGNASFNLEASDDIGPSANWGLVSGATSPVTVTPANARRFYRLAR
jgi:hypothetical protein